MKILRLVTIRRKPLRTSSESAKARDHSQGRELCGVRVVLRTVLPMRVDEDVHVR